MRILYVITKANWGGAQKYVYDLAVAAKEAGHEVSVLAGGSGPLTEKLATSGVRVIELPLRNQRFFLLNLLTFSSLFTLIRIFAVERPQIVHANSAKAGGLGTLAGRIAGVPRIIFTAHGWEFNAPRPLLSRMGIRLFSWFTVLLSHNTICVSDAIRKDIAWMPFVRSKLVVIHNGISCPAVLPRTEARAMLASSSHTDTYWIGMLSELHPTKRIDDAIRAMKLLSVRFPNAFLVVMGEGQERERLEKLIRDEGLGERVRLAGFVKDGASLLSAFDLFLHSSRSEALAYAVLEAGCASLPVVATRVGGLPEIIPNESYGMLVPPEDPAALARAMVSLMQDSAKARETGTHLHDRIMQEFSKERMVRDTLSAYSR